MTRTSPSRCTPRWVVSLLASAVLLLQQVAPGVAHAEGITFDQALALGARTPDVTEPEAMLASRETGDQKMRGAADATNLIFMPGALVWRPEVRGFDMQATITQGWNLRGLGAARRDSAYQEREELAATVRARALRARLGAARRWIDLATLGRVVESLDARIEGAKELVARRERALATGVGTSAPLTEARALLAELRQHRLDLEGDQFSAATQLSVAVGRPPSSEALVPKGELPNPQLPDERELRGASANVDDAPDVMLERLHATASQARAIEASAQYSPVLTLGAQGERGAFGNWVVYGVTGVTFRGPGQQRRLTSVANAHALGASEKTAGARLRARAELEEAMHEVKHSAAVVKLLEEETLPALRRLVESRERGVALGEDPYFALLAARDRELATIETAHRAHGASAWARVHMWLLLAELESEGPAQ